MMRRSQRLLPLDLENVDALLDRLYAMVLLHPVLAGCIVALVFSIQFGTFRYAKRVLSSDGYEDWSGSCSWGAVLSFFACAAAVWFIFIPTGKIGPGGHELYTLSEPRVCVVFVVLWAFTALAPLMWYRLGTRRFPLYPWPERLFGLSVGGTWALVFAVSFVLLFVLFVMVVSQFQSEKPMSETIAGAVYGALATVVVGLLAAFIAWKQYQVQRQQLEDAKKARDEAKALLKAEQRRLREGPKAFVRNFGTMIDNARAAAKRGDGDRALFNLSAAIVSQAKSLKQELGGLERLLNSDIDVLANRLAENPTDWTRVSDVVETLEATWKQKESEAVLRISRILATLEFVTSFEDDPAPTS